jgi:MoaD family protein
MVKIKITFLSILSDIIGKREMSFKIGENSSVKDLLESLKKDLGYNFETNFFESDNSLKKYIIIALNGKDIRQEENLATKMHNGDNVSFLPAIAGG